MPKAPKTERLTLDGPVGPLEAILELPAEGPFLGSAIVCHPHPLYGGTMTNKVAHTLARAFVYSGYAALRFNFRGTGASGGNHDDGVGEVDDARTALEFIRERFPDTHCWVAGFSFGAAVAVKLAAIENVAGLISIAPAISRFGGGMAQQPDCPWLIVQGDRDELIEIDETVEWIDSLEPGPELIVVPDAEHFFHGRLIELRGIVSDFIERIDAER